MPIISRLNSISANRLYAPVLILSLIMYIMVAFSSEYVYNEAESSKSSLVFLLAFLLFSYLYILILLVRKLGLNPRVIIWLNIVPPLVLVFSTVTVFVDLTFLGATKPYLFISAHLFTTTFFVICIYVILKHVFSSNETKVDHIWGATVAYLLLIVIFSEIYEYITIFNPTYLGKTYVMGTPNYIQCLMFSINTMSGLDSVYPEAHPILKKLASIESVIGNLFLVIILGRLLSHPLKIKK